MAKQVKDRKSAHLMELENVFERRTRRFSPFEVLGLKSEVNAEEQEKGGSETSAAPSHTTEKTDEPTTIVEPMEGSDPPTPGSSHISSVQVGEALNQSPIERQERLVLQRNASDRTAPPSTRYTLSAMADVVAATQAGAQIGPKARKALAYLNTIRSLEYDAYTVPVGYGQISSHVGVDSDYLRRKALPKLAMLGFIAIARKSLEGTVYHLPHDREYIAAVTGESFPNIASVSAPIIPVSESTNTFSWPEWIDKEQWGWLSEETIQRLVQKAGSIAQAREKLEIIIYNETHGAPHQRVRSRRSVLAHYLSSPQAEIWPNDEGFETLTMKQARLEREQAQKEKALAEEVLRTKREAHKARFYASLSDFQLQWIKQEAKRIVDMRPEAKLLTSRFPLYKAEEDLLLEEWMERVGYGETVPSIQEAFDKRQ